MNTISRRKIILISIIAVIVIAALSFGTIYGIRMLTAPKPAPAKTTTLSGDSVAIDKTPSFKTCQLVDKATIQKGFGDQMSEITDGTRAGVIASSGAIAEDCEYDFTTAKTTDNSLSIQTYTYTTTAEGEKSKEQMDASWIQLTYAKQPSYFHTDTSSDGNYTIDTLRVITGPKNYLFVVRQPKDKVTFTDLEVRAILVQISSNANYSVSNDDPNAPPAPDVPTVKV